MDSDVAQLEEYLLTIPKVSGGPPPKRWSGCAADLFSQPWERWRQKDEKIEASLISLPYPPFLKPVITLEFSLNCCFNPD